MGTIYEKRLIDLLTFQETNEIEKMLKRRQQAPYLGSKIGNIPIAKMNVLCNVLFSQSHVFSSANTKCEHALLELIRRYERN